MNTSRLSVKQAWVIMGSCFLATTGAVGCLILIASLNQKMAIENERNGKQFLQCKEDRDRYYDKMKHFEELLCLSADSSKEDEEVCFKHQIVNGADDTFGGFVQINPFLEDDLQTYRVCLEEKRHAWRRLFEPAPVKPVLPLPALPLPKSTP